MTAAAPRIPFALLRTLARAARPGVVYADVWREVGAAADALGVTRPSYHRVRVLAHDVIERRARRRAIALALAEGIYDPLIMRGAPKAGAAALAGVAEIARSAAAYHARRRK